jgi:hypothetical protein
MDTQGMSLPISDKKNWKIQPHKPMEIHPRRLFTPEYVKELKILFNEVLDEREGKMNYTSYFDTEHFKHRINEPEPPYKQQ